MYHWRTTTDKVDNSNIIRSDFIEMAALRAKSQKNA